MRAVRLRVSFGSIPGIRRITSTSTLVQMKTNRHEEAGAASQAQTVTQTATEFPTYRRIGLWGVYRVNHPTAHID